MDTFNLLSYEIHLSFAELHKMLPEKTFMSVSYRICWYFIVIYFFQFIRDENERSLREAMILSKLDFEEKKDFYAQMKKEQHDDHKGKGKKKKDKPLTMSLDQFNSLRPDQVMQNKMTCW